MEPLQPQTSPPAATTAKALLKATSMASVLLFALYQSYALLADWMHGYSAPTDPARVNPWLRGWVGEHDGIETYVMFALVTGFLLVGYAVARWLPRIPWFRSWPVQLVCLAPAATVLARIHSSNFGRLELPFGNFKTFGAGFVAVALAYVVCRLTEERRWLGRALLALGLAALGLLVLLSASPPSPFDYGFFIAPATKLMQGEPLGSFYIQYNLVGVYLFRLMMAFRLHLPEMQAVLALLFALWVGLYWLLAKRLMEDRFLIALFVVGLLVFRFFSVRGGPVHFPQVSTLRMDLWVLLALVLERFGLASRVTAAAFALGYLADNVFGFLFFAFYGAALAATLVADWKAGRRPAPALLLGLAAPLAAALAFQLWTFGTLTNPAGKLYQDIHLGFLPISLDSMFWAVGWILLAAIYPVSTDPNEKRRTASLFLFAFAAGQLLYFYGRSHDHNLLNLSGIWVLILFVGLDRLRHSRVTGWVGRIVAVVLICAASVGAGREGMSKLRLVESRVSQRVWIAPLALDGDIDNSPDPFAAYRSEPKLLLLSYEEGYLNYRFRLPQTGYFAPFFASVFVESTAQFLRQLVLDGYKVLLWKTDPGGLEEFNNTEAMRSAGQRFVALPRGPVLELELALRGPNG